MMACVDTKISSPILNSPPSPPSPVEASGDSEEGFDSLQPSESLSLVGSVDDDDTESCSGDNRGVRLDDSESDGGGDQNEEEQEEDSQDHHEGAMAWQPAARGRGMALKSESSDLDEAERSRIFWETCLQSGYP